MTSLLSANDLCLFRGEKCLFQSLDFTLQSGEMLLIEGPNGSGKTSLLKAVAGLIDFDEGNVVWRGRDTRSAAQAFRASFAWFAHRTGFKLDLTPLENLRFEAALRSPSRCDALEALHRSGAEITANLPMRVLSAGQQRRIAIARMLMASAPIWILDEPFTNLDVAGRELVTENVNQHLVDGGLALVASHHAVAIDAPIRRVTLS